MEAARFEMVLRDLAPSRSRRALLRRLGAIVLGVGGVPLVARPSRARRRKKRKGGKGGKGGGGGGSLDVFAVCDPDANACQSGLRCDTPGSQRRPARRRPDRCRACP